MNLCASTSTPRARSELVPSTTSSLPMWCRLVCVSSRFLVLLALHLLSFILLLISFYLLLFLCARLAQTKYHTLTHTLFTLVGCRSYTIVYCNFIIIYSIFPMLCLNIMQINNLNYFSLTILNILKQECLTCFTSISNIWVLHFTNHKCIVRTIFMKSEYCKYLNKIPGRNTSNRSCMS